MFWVPVRFGCPNRKRRPYGCHVDWSVGRWSLISVMKSTVLVVGVCACGGGGGGSSSVVVVVVLNMFFWFWGTETPVMCPGLVPESAEAAQAQPAALVDDVYTSVYGARLGDPDRKQRKGFKVHKEAHLHAYCMVCYFLDPRPQAGSKE